MTSHGDTRCHVMHAHTRALIVPHRIGQREHTEEQVGELSEHSGTRTHAPHAIVCEEGGIDDDEFVSARPNSMRTRQHENVLDTWLAMGPALQIQSYRLEQEVAE